MRRVFCFLVTLIFCLSIFVGCGKGATQPSSITTTQTTEGTTQLTEETTRATEETTQAQQPFCSVCQTWYEGMVLENGQCENCRNGQCFLCGGPDGPEHNCDDYPNVLCPNPQCDWGIFTTGVGIEGIVCPKCGTRCV